MTTNHKHTPNTEADIREDFSNRQAGAINRAVARENFDHMIAAAEQRGAVKALRDAATSLRDSKFANSVKPPHEKVQVPEADWLDYRADQMEGDE